MSPECWALARVRRAAFSLAVTVSRWNAWRPCGDGLGRALIGLGNPKRCQPERGGSAAAAANSTGNSPDVNSSSDKRQVHALADTFIATVGQSRQSELRRV